MTQRKKLLQSPIDWKIYACALKQLKCKIGYSTLENLQIQCEPNKTISILFTDIEIGNLKFYMETEKMKASQKIPGHNTGGATKQV